VTSYRRNPALAPRWSADAGDRIELLDGRTGRSYRIQPAVFGLLNRLTEPTDAAGLELDGFDAGGLAALLERMAGAGIVERCADRPPGEPADLFADRGEWSAAELAVHAQSALGGKPSLVLDEVPPARVTHPEALASLPLPEHDPPGGTFAEVLAARRSVRAFAPEPPSLDQLAALLGRAARVRGRLGPDSWQTTSRPSPSGGGRHSLELYLLVRAAGGLEPGAYHYDPFDHTLNLLARWEPEHDALQRRLLCAPMGVETPPPVSLYLGSWYRRTQVKYGGMTLSLIYRDAGCLLQTLYLAGQDLGLAGCATAAMEAAPTPGFLRPHRDKIVHAGNFALGRPAGPAGTDPELRPLPPDGG
jgi:SagB-type dehydrogenase family enzyme